MRGLAFWFMVLGVMSALIGMGWGIYMAGTQDHGMSPAHGHLNLFGFVAFSIFALYYHVVPGAGLGRLPKVHFLLSVTGLVVVVPGIVLAIMEVTEVIAATGSMISALGMLCFLVVVLRGGHSR